MKKRYILTFQPENINIPITYNLIKQFAVKINILNADLSTGKTGHLVLEIESDEKVLHNALHYVESQKIQFHELLKQLDFKEEQCISCGSCTAVCFSGALKLNTNWKLDFDHEKCVVCGLCVKACPLQLFNLEIDQYV